MLIFTSKVTGNCFKCNATFEEFADKIGRLNVNCIYEYMETDGLVMFYQFADWLDADMDIMGLHLLTAHTVVTHGDVSDYADAVLSELGEVLAMLEGGE